MRLDWVDAAFAAAAGLAALAITHVMLATAAPSVKYDAQEAWEFTCQVTQYDCASVPMPKVVVYEGLWGTYGAIGAYAGGDEVWLDGTWGPALDFTYVQSILAHEMTHYLDVSLGHVDMNDMTTRCTTEFNGWRVGNAYLVANGRPDLADFAWNLRYGCF